MPDDIELIDHKQPPTTVREVGIHLVYMSKSVAEINEKLNKMSESYATKTELSDAVIDRRREQDTLAKELECLTARVSVVEKFISGIMKKIAGYAVTALVLMILASYGLEKYFR